MRTGDLDSPTFADCNTAHMTVGDLGHWLLRLYEDEHHEHALVSDSIARPVLELLGYALTNPTWWRSEESHDHHISWLYCGGERTVARHLTGRMYVRGGLHARHLQRVHHACTAELPCGAGQRVGNRFLRERITARACQ